MPESLSPSKYLRAEVVAEMLDITEHSLAQDRYLGIGIPYVKIGKRVRYRLEDVHAFIEANTVVTAPANRPARVHRAKRV